MFACEGAPLLHGEPPPPELEPWPGPQVCAGEQSPGIASLYQNLTDDQLKQRNEMPLYLQYIVSAIFNCCQKTTVQILPVSQLFHMYPNKSREKVSFVNNLMLFFENTINQELYLNVLKYSATLVNTQGHDTLKNLDYVTCHAHSHCRQIKCIKFYPNLSPAMEEICTRIILQSTSQPLDCPTNHTYHDSDIPASNLPLWQYKNISFSQCF